MTTLAEPDAKRDLCAVIGHELRNPLASAVTSLGVASEMTADGDPREPFIARAMDELDRISGLLTSFLEFGSSARIDERDVALGALWARLAERFDGFVDVRVPANDLYVLGDERLLERAFENLIENARHAGARRVRVLLVREGTDAAVHLVDDGPGIPAAVRDRMFEPFASGRGSTGLGLAVTQRILDAHAARIALLPTELGARFRVAIPLAW